MELEENLNFFKFDADYQMKENQWDEIKKEILGEYADIMMKSRQQEEDEINPEALEKAEASAAGVPIDPNSINYQKVSKYFSCHRCNVLITFAFCFQEIEDFTERDLV